MAEEGVCPIESNIKSTAGGGKDISEENDYQLSDNDGFNDGFNDEFADKDDELFDEDDGDGLDGDDDWGSVHSQNDQDIIKSSFQDHKKDHKPVIGVNDENPFGEGNEVAVRNGAKPEIRMDDPKQKCWICDVCNGINNLLESMQKYNYRCCICSYAYHPNVAIIFSNDWDGVDQNNPNEQIYTIWNCPFCTLKNDISWNKCDGCEQSKPPQGQFEVGYTYIKPKKLNGPEPAKNNHPAYNQNNNRWGQGNNNNNNFNWGNNNNNNNNKGNKNKNNHNRNIVRKPRIGNIGIPRGIESYPAKSVMDDKIEKRLSDIFGKPFRNKLLSQSNDNTWTTNCSLSHSRIEWASYSNDAKNFVTEEIVGRGFAVNQRTGWIATMSINYIWVFEPFGSCGYRLKARYQFTEEQKLNGEDVQNSRIRFVGESIFVWSFARSRVYSFKISYNSIILVDVIKDKYFKDSQTMDVAITDNLLILLFDRWCGVYKLYPKFEWYHAVAFATKAVNCFSFEICDYDDELDRTPMYQEPFFRDEDEEKSDKIGNNNNNKRSKRNRKSLKEKWRKQMKREQEQKDDENAFFRSTNKNYLFINAENQLIGIHPTNPTFDFLHIAKEAQHGKCKYCVSKRYGTFYLSNDGKELYQSSHLEYQTTQKLISLNNSQFQAEKFYPIEQYHDLVLRQGINKFCNLRYDETYGVSGRLLLFCQTKKSEYIIHQLFNHNELTAFSDELSRIDYYLMPGSARKPFNLYVYVYEMLYGEDLIETLLKSQYFNPAELKIKKQQELELQKIENEAQQPKEQDFLFINNVGQEEAPNGNEDDNPGVDMDIEYEGEGEGNST